MAVHTPAKLNLSLDILGRRPDGYHELETIMVSIGLYDTLLFAEDDSHQTRLRCHQSAAPQQDTPSAPAAPANKRAGQSLSAGPDNLVVRAAELLRQHTGCDRGVTIDLWKRIPLQAGLGGGSSDAAATLVGLNRFWKLGLAPAELHPLAARLGSDVNFFLDSPLAAVCTGRGEQIEPLTVPQRLHFVVTTPLSGLSTADVFRAWQQQTHQPRDVRTIIDTLRSGRILTEPDALHNVLETSACILNPDVTRALSALRAAGATHVLMSGSGTSCFAVCRTAPHARALARRVRQQNIGRVNAVSLRA